MRNAIYAMNEIQSQIEIANIRLSTGKKVNSAVDDARSYFAAQAFSSEAEKLNGLLEGMGQARQTIDKVSKTIDGAIRLLSSADSLARQAQQSSVNAERTAYRDQVAELLNQTIRLFSDGSFNGKQLFISDLTKDATYAKKVGTATGELGHTDATAAEKAAYGAGTLTVNVNTATTNTARIVVAPIDVRFSTEADKGGLYLTRGVKGANDTGFVTGNTPGTDVKVTTDAQDGAAWDLSNAAQITQFRSDIQKAMSSLASKSATVGAQTATIDIRMSFTKESARINSQAADSLVVADVNEEGAKLSALQTKQQIAVQALTLANRADQTILRLF
jgi:flagellin-like hook-associated protein FlgL